MHDYAIFGHDRAAIGRWLGVIALLSAAGISQLLASATQLTGIGAFGRITLTTGIAYFFIHWAFNKYIWNFSVPKIPYLKNTEKFNIPDISGTWSLAGQSLNEDGTTKFPWHGTIGIEQNWKQIAIHLQTETSQSNSYTATLARRHGPTGGWLLSYSYKNEPELEHSHELRSHKGYCEIEFNNELSIGKAAYFNSNGRRTFGVITMKRIQK